jgi:hypothetical protein
MSDDGAVSRRSVLRTLGTGVVSVAAGCNTGGDERSPTPTRTRTSTPTDVSTDSPTERGEETVAEMRWTVDPVDHDKLVGAHYMQWYRGDDGIEGSSAVTDDWTQYTPDTPALGSYNSLDEDVINQHVKWAREHGINWFITSGYAHLEELWDAELADEMQWSPLIGGARFEQNKFGGIDFSREVNRQKLVDEIGHMADNFFGDPKYMRIDDRPVVYLYAVTPENDGFQDAVAAAEDRAGTDVYWIKDYPQYTPPAQQESSLPAMDALSTFTPYRPIINEDERFTDMPEFVDAAEERLTTRRLAAEDMDYTFIPTVTPGYNDHLDARKTAPEGSDETGTHPVLERDPDIFEEYCRTAIDYMDPDLQAIIISTWGGWLENTQVEPTEEHGTAFLEAARDGIATADPDFIDPANYPALEIEFNRTETPSQGRARHLAFRLHGLSAPDQSVLDYEVGGGTDDHIVHNLDHPDQQVYFSEGCYAPSGNDDIPAGRWLGGDQRAATIYLDPTIEDPDDLVLTGRPFDPDIRADIRYEGETAHELSFDDGMSDYHIPLTTEG